MSLLGKIAALFSGGSARKVCVVDGDRLVGGDRVGPGERFQALNRLSRFAAREELSIKVVFGGRPLREADEGADYNGVQVFYAESPDEVRTKIAKTLSSVGRSSALLVTGDATLELEQTTRGFASMRISTLRKAMDPASEGGGRDNGGREGRDRGDRGDRGDRRGGRNRNRGRRPQSNESRDNQASENQNRSDDNQSSNDVDNQDNRGNRENRGNSGADASVKNLIDLVE